MTTRTTLKALSTALALCLPALPVAVSFLPGQVAAATLPSPYVSRALSAVLIPVNADTISAFGLAADETGVLVLSVAPGGVADQAGIAPGDVISAVQGEKIVDPIRLDEVVYYWIKHGTFDFGFDAWRAGAPVVYNASVTEEIWAAVIDLASIATWSAYASDSFSYSEYYAEYSEEITASYESSETTIEETATSEEFSAEVTSEDTSATEAADDSSGDAAATDDGADDTAATDDGGDDAAASDDGGDDAAGTDDGGDDAGGDDGGDSGGDDGSADTE